MPSSSGRGVEHVPGFGRRVTSASDLPSGEIDGTSATVALAGGLISKRMRAAGSEDTRRAASQIGAPSLLMDAWSLGVLGLMMTLAVIGGGRPPAPRAGQSAAGMGQ